MGNMADEPPTLGQGSALVHYKLAEAWAYKAEPGHASARGHWETPENCAAIAQVHATLALAGATALAQLTPGSPGYTGTDHTEWKAAASANARLDDVASEVAKAAGFIPWRMTRLTYETLRDAIADARDLINGSSMQARRTLAQYQWVEGLLDEAAERAGVRHG